MTKIQFRNLTEIAFQPVELSDGSEPHIIDRLRRDGDLSLSLVAIEQNAHIVGHVAFSPVAIADAEGKWYGLGPISVHPDFQGLGIGSKLLQTGLERLKEMKATGCVVIGDPEWYQRFGFKSHGTLLYGEVPSKYVQWISFTHVKPKGEVRYSPGFDG